MKRLLFTLRPLSAFGSRPNAGMLFGQLCYTIRLMFGRQRLVELLEGYCEGRPFAVVSDAMPAGCVPLPTIPLFLWVPCTSTLEDRKRWKKMCWMAIDGVKEKPGQWHRFVRAADELVEDSVFAGRDSLFHNTIRRDTLTTGTGQFAPYQKTVIFFSPRARLEVHAVIDDERMPMDDFVAAVRAMGQTGFGADASAGLGKFDVEQVRELPSETAANRYYLALSAFAPQGLHLDASGSYYGTQTYFGRHGGERVHGVSPFKRPLLLAATGALIDCGSEKRLHWIGRGISGHSVYADTVHQGYAVVIPLTQWSASETPVVAG